LPRAKENRGGECIPEGTSLTKKTEERKGKATGPLTSKKEGDYRPLEKGAVKGGEGGKCLGIGSLTSQEERDWEKKKGEKPSVCGKVCIENCPSKKEGEKQENKCSSEREKKKKKKK